MLTNKSKQRKTKQRTERPSRIVNNFYSKDDPLGSYTGVPENEDELPVQDADDL